MTREHPFLHAYPIEKGNSLDAKAVGSIDDFIRQSMGQTDSPRPKVWVVGHEHMQRAAKAVPHYQEDKSVIGWFSQSYPDKVFISDQMKVRKPEHAAVLAHELAHYYQHQAGDTRPMHDLEADADFHMASYYGYVNPPIKTFREFVEHDEENE